jgi:hypothetical protein
MNWFVCSPTMVKPKRHTNSFFPNLDYMPIAWEPERTARLLIHRLSINLAWTRARRRGQTNLHCANRTPLWSLLFEAIRTRSLPHHQILCSRYVRVHNRYWPGLVPWILRWCACEWIVKKDLFTQKKKYSTQRHLPHALTELAMLVLRRPPYSSPVLLPVLRSIVFTRFSRQRSMMWRTEWSTTLYAFGYP